MFPLAHAVSGGWGAAGKSLFIVTVGLGSLAKGEYVKQASPFADPRKSAQDLAAFDRATSLRWRAPVASFQSAANGRDINVMSGCDGNMFVCTSGGSRQQQARSSARWAGEEP